MLLLMMLLMLVSTLDAAAAATVTLDWSTPSAGSPLVYPVSVYVSVGDTLAFVVPSDAAGTAEGVAAVVDLASRLPDTQPGAGAFTLAWTAPQDAPLVVVDGSMVGRAYLIVDNVAGHAAKTGQVVVRSRSDSVVPITSANGSAVNPETLSLHVDVGDLVVWQCPTCSLVDRAWIADADGAGNVLPSAGPPFEMGPRAAVYARSFSQAGLYFYMSPTLPDVRGVITVGVPTNASELLPLRNAMLQCQCVWPDLPCQGEPLYPPQPNTTSVATPPPPTVCPNCVPPVDGFPAGVLFVSAVYGSNCPPNDGSASLPFRSIGRAVCAASAGTLIVVTMDGTFYEDMLEWHSCASCVHFVLEDRADNSELGTATLLSGGLVHLRKDAPDWAGNVVNLKWFNTDRFSQLVNRTGTASAIPVSFASRSSSSSQ